MSVAGILMNTANGEELPLFYCYEF